MATALCAALVLPQSAFAATDDGDRQSVATPDEENWLDVLDGVPNPALLPRLVDLGLIDASVDNLVPDVLDPWPDVTLGGCGLATAGPSASSNQLRVKGSAAYACTGNQAEISVTLCLQIRSGGQWHIIEGSCRRAQGANESSVSKRTSAYCRPGTWRYRVFAVGSASGFNGSENLASRKSAPATIDCRTFGL